MKHSMDAEWKRMETESNTEIPEVVRKRIDDTLAALPAQRRVNRARRRTVISAAVAASVACVMVVGFTVPSLAEALREAPVIGSVFKLVGDSSLKTAQEEGIVTEINQSATDKGYDVKITEVLFDGSQLSIGYVLSSDEELPEDVNPFPEFSIDGESHFTHGASGHGDRIDAHTYAGLLKMDAAQKMPESFELGLTFSKFGDTKGTWAFSFPVKEQSKDNKTVMPMQPKTYGGTTILIEKITFAATATEVVGQIKQPSATGLASLAGLVDFELVDDKGNVVKNYSNSGNGPSFKELFPPVQETPKSITIRPIRRSNEPLDAATVKGLEMTIPIEDTQK
jgi:hypothetical protein